MLALALLASVALVDQAPAVTPIDGPPVEQPPPPPVPTDLNDKVRVEQKDLLEKTLALLDTQKVTYYRLSDPRQVWVKVDPAVLPRDDFYTKFQVDPFPMAGDMLPIALGITLLDPEKPAVVFGSLRGIYRLRASPDSLLNLTDHTFGAVVRSQPTFALTSTHRVLEGAAPFVYPNAGIANGYVVPLEALTNNPAAAEAFKAVAIPNLIGPQD
jgi:hypothetical protein